MAKQISDFEYVLKKIKARGRFQILALMAVCYNNAICGMISFQAVYISYTPDYRCNVDPLDNETVYPGLSEDDILNYTTPYDGNNYNGCQRYGYDLSECTGSLDCVNTSAGAIPCDNGYHYDTSIFTETTTTQFDLVCDRRIYFTIEASTFMLAYLIGALIMGPLADKYGRKLVVLSSAISTSFFSGLLLLSPAFYVFGILRFFLSMSTTGTFMGSFMYILEAVDVDSYALFGLLVQVFYAVGYMMWSFIAYVWRDWHQMQTLHFASQNFASLFVQMVSFLITLPFVFVSILPPESPRWLFCRGKEEEGKKATYKIALINGTSGNVNEELWENSKSEKVMENNEISLEKKHSYFIIFKKGRIRIISIIVICSHDRYGFNILFLLICIIWWELYFSGVHALVYYGIGFSAGQFPGNLFITNLIAGAFEITAYVVCILALKYYGRVTIMLFCLVLSGICLLISTTLLLLEEYPVLFLSGTIFAYLGKAAIAGSWGVIYNYTSEVYSTDVRGNANGFAIVGGGGSAILYPIILSLYYIYPWLPGIIFALLAIAAGSASIKLPETQNEPLLNTLEEAEAFYERKSKKSGNDRAFVNECCCQTETTVF